MPDVSLAGAAQQLLVLQTEECKRGAVRAAGARGSATGPTRSLGLLPQQCLHQVVERVVGAQLPGSRSFLAHRARGRSLHLPAAAHTPAAKVVAAAQRHRVAERVVAYSAQQLLFEGARRSGGHRGARLHCRNSSRRDHHRRRLHDQPAGVVPARQAESDRDSNLWRMRVKGPDPPTSGLCVVSRKRCGPWSLLPAPSRAIHAGTRVRILFPNRSARPTL